MAKVKGGGKVSMTDLEEIEKVYNKFLREGRGEKFKWKYQV